MLSFDVVLLFTVILVDKACDYISNKLLKDDTLSSRTSLDSNEIISLLNFILCNNYFIYNDNMYKQIHGCAMGSPVNPVVANLCMEAIEEAAISTSEYNLKYGNAMWMTAFVSSKGMLSTLFILHLIPSIHTSHSLS